MFTRLSLRPRVLATLSLCLSLTILGGAAAWSPEDDPVAGLIKALADENALVRKRSAIALQRLGPAARPAVPALQKALADPDADVRAAAAAALRAIGGPLSREELIHRLKDRQQPGNVRGAACKELVDRFGADPAVIQALESVLADPAVKLEAAQALEAFDKRRRLERVAAPVTLKGHAGPLNCVAFSADGRLLATGSGEPGKPGEIKFWDTAAARERLTLRGHGEAVLALAFTADGKILASGSGVFDRKREKWVGGEIKLWDVSSGDEITTLEAHSRPVTALAFTADGKTLVSASEDRTVMLWDAVQRQERRTLKGHAGAVHALAVSADGQTLATGSADRTVRLWDLPAGKERLTLRGHAGPVLSVALSADGKTLAAGSGVYSIDMGKWLSGEVKVWDAVAGQERAVFKRHTDAVAAVALTADGQTLATGSWDSTVKLWDVSARQERTTLPAHTSRVNAVGFSGDGKYLATGSADRTAKLWKLVWEKP